MISIWKFELEITDAQSILMPEGAEILCVQNQDEIGCLWAKVNPDAENKEERIIYIKGTGHTFNEDPGKYIGTFQMSQGALVWHVFEKIN